MKNAILLPALFLLSPMAFADGAQKAKVIECSYDDAGYDQETLFLELGAAGDVTGLRYESYMGEVGPFTRSENLAIGSHVSIFEFTEPELLISHIVHVSSDLKRALQLVVYKDTGSVLGAQEFVCETEK